jgi:starvation-inducible DNA-binding protein
MTTLTDKLKVVLADTFALYLKTHNFHWNVEGSNFPQYHSFFDTLYNELWEATDAIAEHIRALNEYAPGSFSRFGSLTNIKDEMRILSAEEMIKILYEDNETVLKTIKDAYNEAEKASEIGLSNFLQDRYDTHKKHSWMLRSTSKKP